jgi:hypothetical protein
MRCRLQSRSERAIRLTLNAEVAEEKNAEEKETLFYLCESSVISAFLNLDLCRG